MSGAVSVHDVAALLTDLQRAQTRSGTGLAGMASSKLHKLTYFCQAYHLAWHGAPLFREDVVAASSGPVIEAFFTHADLSFPDNWPEGSASNLDDGQRLTVDTLFHHHSFSTGLQLGETAREHVPWIRAREKQTEGLDRPVIDPADMTAYYRALLDAPKTRQDYAARFMDRYRSGTVMDTHHSLDA